MKTKKTLGLFLRNVDKENGNPETESDFKKAYYKVKFNLYLLMSLFLS